MYRYHGSMVIDGDFDACGTPHLSSVVSIVIRVTPVRHSAFSAFSTFSAGKMIGLRHQKRLSTKRIPQPYRPTVRSRSRRMVCAGQKQHPCQYVHGPQYPGSLGSAFRCRTDKQTLSRARESINLSSGAYTLHPLLLPSISSIHSAVLDFLSLLLSIPRHYHLDSFAN